MQFIETIIDLIDDRVGEVAASTFTRVADVLTPGFKILTVLLVVLYGFNLVLRFTNFSFPQLISLLVKIGGIYLFLYSWSQFSTIYNAASLLFDSVGNLVRNFVAGGAAGDTESAANTMFGTLADVINEVVTGSSVMTRALVSALLFAVLGILATVYIIVVAYSKLMLGVLIGIAPLMGFFLLFERTKSMFEAWLAACFGYLVYPVAVGAIIGIIAGLLQNITTDVEATNSLASMLGFITVALLGIKMLSDVPSIASSLTGQFNLGSTAGAAAGAMMNPLSAVRNRATSFTSGFMHGRTPHMQAKFTDNKYANLGLSASGAFAEKARSMRSKISEIDKLRKS